MSPYVRFTEGPNRNKFDTGTWAIPEFGILADLEWTWTEKVDGTNVRVIWDGYKVSLGGRTDDAQMPVVLIDALREMFPEELMEQRFGATPVVLYGEGFGPKINKGGGNYGAKPSFVLFDVKIGQWWLMPNDTRDIASKLGIAHVPLVYTGSVHDAIKGVTTGLQSAWGEFSAEGLVGQAPQGLLTRGGERILMKIKRKDFPGVR
jgi:hypothetical protein